MNPSVILINPSVNPESQNKVINAVINKTFPTSLGVLAGYLEARGIRGVNIVDEQLTFLDDDVLSKLIICAPKPVIVGLSVLTINARRAYSLARKIKDMDPGVTVVMGGIHPTVLPEEALAQRGVDVVVRGEGEETFFELVSLIGAGKDYRLIKGISFKKEGVSVRNPDRQLIAELDSIPPFPYHFFAQDRSKYPSFGSLLTSRGCPYNCIFCSSRSISGKSYRYFSVERVISEIRTLVHKYGQKTIWMMDDNLAANRARFLKLLDAIIAEKFAPDVHFHGSMRADNVTDELLDKAAQAHFKMISYGMETADESLMRLIDKGETVNQVVEAVGKTAQKNIAVATTIIFGLPGETRADRYRAMRMVSSLPLSSVRFNILTPYPGTPAYDLLTATGEVSLSGDWVNFAVQYMWEADDLPYVPLGNNRYELMFDTMWANLSFYLSVKGLARMLRSSFAGGNVITLSEKWYFSPRKILTLASVGLYLSARFISVTLKMCKAKLACGSVNTHNEIKDNMQRITLAISRIKEGGIKQSLYARYAAKVAENVLYERYTRRIRPVYAHLPFNYQRIPPVIRYRLQSLFTRKKAKQQVFPSWPIEDSLERLRASVYAYSPAVVPDTLKLVRPPKNTNCFLVLTHDIEAQSNWKWVKVIAGVEMELGFRSSWNVVPSLYKIDFKILDWLVENGFEIGLHDHNHDNKLAFLSQIEMRKRLDSSRAFIDRYRIQGFRAGSWLRSQRLFKVLQEYVKYDTSVLDVDYISPSGTGGCCSIFPFMMGKMVELPTTVPYEFPVQLGVAISQINAYWEKKIRWIKEQGGLINVITHPDPYYGGKRAFVDEYRKFLEDLCSDALIALMLPRELAQYYLDDKFSAQEAVNTICSSRLTIS